MCKNGLIWMTPPFFPFPSLMLGPSHYQSSLWPQHLHPPPYVKVEVLQFVFSACLPLYFLLSSIKRPSVQRRTCLHVSLFCWKVGWLQFRGWGWEVCCARALPRPVDCESILAMGSPPRTLYSERRANNGDLEPPGLPPLPHLLPDISI